MASLTFGCKRPARARVRRVRIRRNTRGYLELAGETARFTFERELLSLNHFFGHHRKKKAAEGEAWKNALLDAMVVHGIIESIEHRQILEGRYDAKTYRAPKQRYRVVVTRYAPKRGNFIKDRVNRLGAAKLLVDACKRVGLIWEDSDEWLDHPDPEQFVSADGKFRTVVEVTPWIPPRLPVRSPHVD